jgi:hypothetical protein
VEIQSDFRKTWAQFKLDFITAHREFRLTNQTAQQSGFHSANMIIEQGRDDSMQDTVDAIAKSAISNSNGLRSWKSGNLDHNQCQTCHSTRGRPCADRSTQEQDRNTEEQEQACLAGTTTRQDNKQRHLLLVAWLSGSEIAYERNMQYKKSGHQDAANKSNTICGVQWGKE